MPPQQPNPPSQYDFIFDAGQPKKAPLSTSSLPMRILAVVVGIFILLLIGIVFIKFLGSGGSSSNKAALLSVMQDQTELIRLGDTGSDSAVSQSTKNLAVNVKLGLSTQQTDLLSYAATQGLKPKTKDLALKQSSQTDSQLAAATSSSTFDTAYTLILKQDLLTYQRDLNKAYGDSGSKGGALLKADFNAAQLLLTQIAQSGN